MKVYSRRGRYGQVALGAEREKGQSNCLWQQQAWCWWRGVCEKGLKGCLKGRNLCNCFLAFLFCVLLVVFFVAICYSVVWNSTYLPLRVGLSCYFYVINIYIFLKKNLDVPSRVFVAKWKWPLIMKNNW